MVALVAVLIFALAVLLALVLGSALGPAFGSALVAAVVAASVFGLMTASMAASTAMLLIFPLLLAKSPSSRVGDVLLSSAVDFVREVATTQACSRDRYPAEVPTYLFSPAT